jgi:ParB family chromosome partitioning protein
VFVGAEAYSEAGGTILRDLFTENRGGYLEDVALLDLLVTAKLGRAADALREAEGWKWTQAHSTFRTPMACAGRTCSRWNSRGSSGRP